jgi:hypothetical protein
VARDDTLLLVVARGVARELEDLRGEVLEHGGEVDGRAGANPLRVVAALEQTVDTADGELEPGLGRARRALAGALGTRARLARRGLATART